MLKDELVALLAPFGQEQVLAFWEQLDAAGRESLSRAIRQLDLALIRRLYEHRGEEAGIRQLAERAGPPPAFRLATSCRPACSSTSSTLLAGRPCEWASQSR